MLSLKQRGEKKKVKKIKTLHVLPLVNIMRQICNLMILFFFNETLLFEEVVCGDTSPLSTDREVSVWHFHCLVLAGILPVAG